MGLWEHRHALPSGVNELVDAGLELLETIFATSWKGLSEKGAKPRDGEGQMLGDSP